MRTGGAAGLMLCGGKGKKQPETVCRGFQAALGS